MIAVFDSGLGGLCALRALRRLRPCEDLLYFGDTARVPYGERSAATLLRFAREDLRFLSRFAPGAVLAACGTVSAVALPTLQRESALPLFGVVEPTVQAALPASKNGRIGVIGTTATVRSGAYRDALWRQDPDLLVPSVACPLFVPLIEGGFAQDARIALPLCEHYLAPLRRQGIDTLILGCTHYPLLAEFIAQVLPCVTLLDAGQCAAEALCASLPEAPAESGEVRFFVSDDPDSFAAHALPFLGECAQNVRLCTSVVQKRVGADAIFS